MSALIKARNGPDTFNSSLIFLTRYAKCVKGKVRLEKAGRSAFATWRGRANITIPANEWRCGPPKGLMNAPTTAGGNSIIHETSRIKATAFASFVTCRERYLRSKGSLMTSDNRGSYR